MQREIKVKLCGINDADILRYCLNHQYQPDYLGFIFYDKSARHISYDQAQEFNEIIANNIPKISVTVNAEFAVVQNIIATLNPDYLQLHGDEDLDYIKKIKKFSDAKIIKAVRIKNNLANYDISYNDLIDAWLFDSDNVNYGGSGESFDWQLLKNLELTKPWFLSGGININNIANAIKDTKAKIFDISSGIEKEKGIKDKDKINKLLNFFENYNAKS